MTGPLDGRRVLVTRERPGELGARLAARGAVVVHVPLIAVTEPPDGGRALAAALERLGEFDWLVVTSAAGAERVAAAAAGRPHLRLAAVGTATAATLEAGSGRRVDLVPTTQRAAGLADAFARQVPTPQKILLAQADRAAGELADRLTHQGHDVETVIAYRTVTIEPDAPAARSVDGADAVVFASGSAVESWHEAFGDHLPPVAVAIGPSTAAVAAALGLKLTGVAADHSLDGLMTELERHFT